MVQYKKTVNFVKKTLILVILLIISFALSIIAKIKGDKNIGAEKAEAGCWSYVPPADCTTTSTTCDGHTCDSGAASDCSY